jgi:signal transduction histidine kinase/CheY-like chemotaxis protein
MARPKRRQAVARDPGSRRSRPILALAAAALLPVLAFVAIQTFVIFSDERRGVERNAAEHAQKIMERVDADLSSNIRAMRAFGQMLPDPATYRPQPNTGARSRLMNEIFPDWEGSIVWKIGETTARTNTLRKNPDVADGEETWSDLVKAGGEPVIDGIRLVGEKYATLLHLPLTGRQSDGFVLTLAVRPQVFQEILLSELPEGTIGAVADREGKFIARSISYDERIGRPGSESLRNALKSGKSQGIYRGKTLEGFENYTAYFVSPTSGWSAHIAIAKSLVDTPRSWSLAIAVIGGLICLALSGGLVFLVAQNNAERRNQETMLMQAQKMESLGQLTGGIAHDFNNLLTVIIGNLEKLKRGIGDNDLKAAADTALTSSRRAAGLTQGLLAYSRRQSLLPRVISVNDLAASMSEIMARTIGENIKVATNLAPDVWMTEVDENQLGSALLNLGVNARDAMPEGGTITISSHNQNLAREAKDLSLKPGDYVVLTVSDTGHGMPADVADRAFEPFFTTKGVGQGTGLGLSQVYGFLRQSGGTAVIESEPNKGTAIHLYLPRSFATPEAAADVQPESPPPPAPTGLRVLLVEDDAAVRAHGRELLADLGHTVVEAEDARTALGAVANSRFDLIFTDIVLPGGMSGLDLQRELRRSYPQLRILLATGYAGHEFEEANGPGNVLLSKPYAREELEAKIAEAMRPQAIAEGAAPCVLLVEDEVLIRMLAVETLEDGGIDVIEAASGAEALAKLKADPARISTAVVDLGLPDTTGDALIAEMRKIRPDLPVLIASGRSGPPTGTDPTLSKPYDPEALLSAVRKLVRL